MSTRSLPTIPITPWQRWGAWLCVPAVLMIAVLLHHHTPGQSSLLPPCLFHEWTGLFCPGCGITRCLHALLHGHFATAWAMHPLAVLTLPLLSLMIFHMMMGAPQWRYPWLNTTLHHLFNARPWALLIVAFFVLRNIPYPPFVWLAPG